MTSDSWTVVAVIVSPSGTEAARQGEEEEEEMTAIVFSAVHSVQEPRTSAADLMQG